MNIDSNEICLDKELRNDVKLKKVYLLSTDWYYARKMETGEEVPEYVIAKRAEAREFIRTNEALEVK